MKGLRLINTITGRPLFIGMGLLCIFLAGLGLGLAMGINWHVHSSHDKQQLRLGGYSFINPLLECEIEGSSVEFTELKPFSDKVKTLVKKIIGKTSKHISVYFRDLDNGPWFGINEKELFSPASLLKIPTMIAFLRQAELKPELLSKKIIYSGKEDYNTSEFFKPAIQLQTGASYTSEELLYRSVAYSDNNANVLIFNSLNPMQLTLTYRDFGVREPFSNSEQNFMSVRQYASFFRILFNASYLSRDMSEKALSYLSQSTFRQGIVAGVPENVVVANKFGERIFPDQTSLKQLHDCGIVYYPDHPYLLCIMSRGEEFADLAENIRDISRLVYEEVDRQVSFSKNKK